MTFSVSEEEKIPLQWIFAFITMTVIGIITNFYTFDDNLIRFCTSAATLTGATIYYYFAYVKRGTILLAISLFGLVFAILGCIVQSFMTYSEKSELFYASVVMIPFYMYYFRVTYKFRKLNVAKKKAQKELLQAL